MNATVKKKWLAELRSGKYRKSRTQLYDKGRKAHCCLGVLRDVVGSEEDGATVVLQDNTLERVGLTRPEQLKLIQLNDRHRGWDAVCEYIEEKL